MSAHTPGPWIAKGSTVYSSDDLHPLPIESGWIEGAWKNEPEAEANARLMAAAPDFASTAPTAADLLGRYAEYIRTVSPADLDLHPYIPEIERVVGELRAAIAKATGESQ